MSSGPTRPRRRRWLLPLAFSLLAALVLGAGALAGVRLLRTPPPARLALGLQRGLVLAPGPVPVIPLPAAGSFDLVSSDAGQLAQLAPTTVMPIGSVAKVMTALVVLEDRPLNPGAAGPEYTITAQDVAFFHQQLSQDGSNVAVSAGEQFSELQLLQALLLPSANNIAQTLAVWVSGSETAFVSRLDARAQTLGMTATHFADASGYSPQTVSTAADLIKLGQAALANPVLASLVATPSAQMPNGSTVHNVDTDLGTVPGWLGIKTGSTPQAGGCLLFAAQLGGRLGGAPAVRVVGAVLGQLASGAGVNQGLAEALGSAAGAVRAAFAAYAPVDPGRLDPPPLSGTLSSAWGSSTGLQAAFEKGTSPGEVRMGTTLTLSGTQVPHVDPTTVAAGTLVGDVTGRLGDLTVATWKVTATGSLGQPSWQWLLTH